MVDAGEVVELETMPVMHRMSMYASGWRKLEEADGLLGSREKLSFVWFFRMFG